MNLNEERRIIISTIKVLGIDLGKSCFHIIGHDSSGHILLKKKFSSSKLLTFLAQHPVCTVAFEACGGSHWLARKCAQSGHKALLIPPQYVKPYVKGNKNDFIDADAIAEAATRPHMRFVTPKSEDSQVIAVMHRIREGYVKERTACMSRIGAILLEFGLSFPRGHAAMKRLLPWLARQPDPLPSRLIGELQQAHDHYIVLNQRIQMQDKKLQQLVEQNEVGQLLISVPGIGNMTASQCLAEVSQPGDFKNGRNLSAWIGLVPRQHSTGGKPTLLGISKRGNKHLRTLFIHGA